MLRFSGLALVAAALAPPLLYAGPYSSGTANTVVGATDVGVPGFVGTDGAGVVGLANTVNPLFVGWATSIASYAPASDVDAIWRDTTAALGPVTGEWAHVVSLGERSANELAGGLPPGSLVAAFAGGIRNGNGADFVVFENGLGTNTSLFAELAYVEVSSNATDFARFAPISLTSSPVSAYGALDPSDVYNLAGKHANGNGNGKSWGTPFDLEELAGHTLIGQGKLDLSNIRYVKIVDIPGTGFFVDSMNNPIYDAHQTWGSGGFDLEAIGVVNAVPEPTAMLAVGLVMAILPRRVRK